MKESLTNQVKKILPLIWLLLVLLNVVSTRETLYVMDVSMHGSTYSQYASNPEYDVTGNSYPKTGDLSSEGIKEMYKLGQEFRKDYIEEQHFLSSKFDPNSIFLESIKDQPGLMSAYAFMLGVYPDSTSYLSLRMDNAQEHQKLVRKTLGLSENPVRGSKKVPVSTDEGFLYWSNPARMCPAIHKKVQSMISSASESVKDEYKKNLFPHLATSFGKSKSSINFKTAHKYLDDYLVAKKTGNKYPKFPNQKSIDKLIEEYEKDYFYEGIVGGNELSRVIATPLINYALVNTFTKSQDTKGNLRDAKIHSLKHSHFFSNEIGFVAFLKALGHPQSTAPKGSQNLRIELFEASKKHFVSISLDGKPLNFADSNHGIFELDSFLKTIYPAMYFGDVDEVWAGREDIAMNVYPKCQDYREYLQKFMGKTSHGEMKKVKKCHLTEKKVQVPVKIPAKTVEHRVDLINVGFVEILQIAPPKRGRVDVRVVEVEREVMVPVIEEKVVVHEVEKLVAEKPTHIHHIKIDTPEMPSGIPPVFLEEAPAAGWPWWLWLIPLICCIPLLALCCRKKKPAPIVRPKQPMAPVVAKPLAKPKEKEIMHIKTEERHSPERKFVIEKKVVDEAEDIEMEITKELQKSRVIRESRASRAVSHGRQTANVIAAESAMDRGSGGGKRKRIKTIKKFGEVIGREIQYLDENGAIIRTERVGLDENEARSDHFATSDVGVNRVEVVNSSNAQYIRGPSADHVFKSTYEREGGRDIEPASTMMMNERRSRRGYSSGRHIETVGYNSGSHAGLVEAEAEYGRYSPGGTRMSRGSAGGGFREEKVVTESMGGGLGGGFRDERIITSNKVEGGMLGGGTRVGGSGNFRSSRMRSGGSGNFRESRQYKDERVIGEGNYNKEYFPEDDEDVI